MKLKGLIKMGKLTLTDAVYLCMRNGSYWTFWGLQETIKEKTGTFYGEPTISAAIRNIRKIYYREKYRLPHVGEVVTKRRISGNKGYEYKLIGEDNG